jgi:hypothetical protein
MHARRDDGSRREKSRAHKTGHQPQSTHAATHRFGFVPKFCGGKYGNTVVPAPSELEFMLYAKKCAKPPSMSYMKSVYCVAGAAVHVTVGADLR